MSFEDKLFRDNLSDAEIKDLRSEELAIWAIRPHRSFTAEAKNWMKIRVALLIAATIYYAYAYRMTGEQSPILILLFCYEFAYYNLRKEKATLDEEQAQNTYRERVMALRKNQSRQ